jgi:hypothetical protein
VYPVVVFGLSNSIEIGILEDNAPSKLLVVLVEFDNNISLYAL